MAPEPPSPSASSTLLPFLPTRSRRGSIASLASSKGEIDKDVLAQALDSIHTSASRSEALTSFHDFDGGAPRGGAKDLVSSGVTGLYDKLKRGFNVGTPEKQGKGKPKSSASRESVDGESIRSNGSRKTVGLGLKQPAAEDASVRSNTSAIASPMLASFTSSGAPLELDPADSKSEAQKKLAEQVEDKSSLTAETKLDSKDNISEATSKSRTNAEPQTQDPATQVELNRARSAIVDGDQSNVATQALARVLTNHEIQIADKPKQPRSLNIGDVDEEAVDDSEPARESMRSPSAPPAAISNQALNTKGRPSDATPSKQQDEARPQFLRVGASHLPGYAPSRASSTDARDDVSGSSSRATSVRPSLGPSPNLNAGLQRKRADMKPPPRPVEPLDHVPMHLKRRVISKAFWMKDENAKDCFYCGQAFSTFRRKHHCRTCGQIFDARCTNLVAGRPFGQPGTIRLCKPCEAMIYGSDDDDSTVFSDDASEFPRSPLARRSFGEDDDLHGKMDGINDDEGNIVADVTTPSIGIPASRRNREAKRRSAIIEFDAAPSLARPTSSHSLISLARRARSSSHRRHPSRHHAIRGLRTADERGPFQPGSTDDTDKNSALPAFHNDNIIDPDLAAFLSDDGSDDEDQQNIFATLNDVNSSSPGERERMGYGGLLTSAMKKGRSRMGTMSTSRGNKEDEALTQASKHLPKLSRNRNSSIGSMSFNRPSPRRSKSNNLLRTAVESAVESEPFDRNNALPPVAPAGAGTKLVRSSAMRGRDAPAIELNHASLNHLRKLLNQLLTDNAMEPVAAWEKALMPILLQCTDDVEPNVQLGDDMDIRHYIKLKKVPGGRPGDTSYISGVVFSKNIALKSMSRSISGPRIAIVTFAIEYARHQAHFMSLEPVIAQEQEYLRNLVGRIVALRPQVLLVQRNVSGLALDLLEKAGITVAYNIKESVLAAVARMTQTTMIKSVDKLAIDPSHLGHCDSFEVKTFVHDGLRKSYIYLSGCQRDLGCTIVLRGTDTKTLRKIKRITEFMCYVAYNLKLETNLLRDQFVSIPSTAADQLQAPESSVLPKVVEKGVGDDDFPGALNIQTMNDDEAPSKYQKLEEECRSRILTASPFVVFMEPYLLTQLRDSEKRLSTYKKLRDHYAAADEEGDEDEKIVDEHFEVVKPEMVHAPASASQPKAVREYLHAVHEAQLEKTTHTYETQRRLMESFMNGESDPFDPYSHQTIVVLHSTVSTINSAPCIGPELLGISFYAGYNRAEPQFEEDCTLGQYIEDLCISANSTCKECGKRMNDHYRQYVHGYGQLSISVSRQQAKMRGYEKTILMWSQCRICKQETSVLPMSDNTWKYSFAKYLELSFWSSPLHPRAGVCQHDIHKDFLRCFGFEDLAVRVQYDPVEIYDVVVPRSTITWRVESDLTVKNEQYSHFVSRLTAFTDSIKKRLDSINIDTLDEKKSMEANDLLGVLRQRAEDDHQELLRKLQEKYAVSRYYEIIPLNRALRFMDEKALSWDEVFSDFERDYFPSETDIRKLATLQLKNMFLESQPPPSTVVSDASDEEEGPETKPARSKELHPRVANQELRSEQAHDVLSSTVEEHRGSIADGGDVTAMIKNDSDDKLGNTLTRKVSPREEQEQAVERNDVKHLDLAIPAHSPPDDQDLNEKLFSDQGSDQTNRPAAQDNKSHEESFATNTKPMSSGLLERIEQIRSSRGDGASEPELVESKIPRLADLKKQEGGLRPNKPPLTRAQSSPSSPVHSPRKSADMASIHSTDSAADAPTGQDNQQSSEKRIGERLGVSRLTSKVGKVTPSLIPRSIPIKSDEANHTKVSALAKHFELMSREFEKERLRERRQRALRSRQARANPLASSRPVVEVYRNATDAVGERTVEQAKAEQQAKDLKAEQKPANEPAVQLRLPSSDESQTRTERTLSPKREDAPPESDTGGEGDVSDVELPQSRIRDASDQTSGVSSSGLISPNIVPELELHPELSIPEHRKNVWFNYLAEFWSKRSASGWAPLEYPLHAAEHVFEDSDIIVREDEPSSVIALSLACADYQAKVQEFRSHPKKQAKTNSQTPNVSSAEADARQKAIEASLLSDTGTHMKYSFAHGSVKASCKIFYAEAFDALRRRCGVSERFGESLSRCLKFDSKGGKTKSLFLKTLDNRFYIKSLQEVELKAFTKFAPDYFAFMSHTLFHGVPSVIAKMFGLFQVIIKNPATGMDFSYYLLVMENLFYERNPNRRFDLKGSMRNRKIESTGQPDEVLLDENLVETIFESPLFVREHARKLLQASVWNDTMWLCKQNVMDYSLMAGFDDQRKELIVGIIDCIRTYTWDKKLESWIKDRGKNKPTITSPKDYRNRFRVSMMQYVLQAPNCWHTFQAQMAPPKTLKEREERDDMPDNTENDREDDGRRSEGM